MLSAHRGVMPRGIAVRHADTILLVNKVYLLFLWLEAWWINAYNMTVISVTRTKTGYTFKSPNQCKGIQFLKTSR